jgi:hypothetical protein
MEINVARDTLGEIRRDEHGEPVWDDTPWPEEPPPDDEPPEEDPRQPEPTKASVPHYTPLPVIRLSTVGEFITTRLTSDKALPIFTGVLHVVVGAGESCKSLLATVCALDAVRRGERILVIDSEMSAEVWRQRLTELGAKPDELDRFLYLPMGTPGALNPGRVVGTCRAFGARIVAWDAALSVLSRAGAKSENDNVEVQKTYERVLLDAIRNDLGIPVAGVLIDHTSAGGTTAKGRGATAKFNDIDMLYGVSLDEGEEPSLFEPWAFTVTVEKDRYALLDSRLDWHGEWRPLGKRRLAVELWRANVATNRLHRPSSNGRDFEAEIKALHPPPTSGNEAVTRLKAAGRGGNRQKILEAFRRAAS